MIIQRYDNIKDRDQPSIWRAHGSCTTCSWSVATETYWQKILNFSKILISCLSLSMPGRKQPCSVSLPLHSITLNRCPTTLALTSISQTSASPCLLPLPPTFSPFWHKHSEFSLWDCHKLALSSSPTTFYQTLALGGFKGTLLNNVRFITLLCYISLWARWWTICTRDDQHLQRTQHKWQRSCS